MIDVLGFRRRHDTRIDAPSTGVTGGARLTGAGLAAIRARYAPVDSTPRSLFDETYLLAADGRYAAYFAPTDRWPRPDTDVIVVEPGPTLADVERAASAFARVGGSTAVDDARAVVALPVLIFPVVDRRVKAVFAGGPDLANVTLFREMLETLLAPRLDRAPFARIIPLGACAASGVAYLCARGRLAPERIYWGTPLPSDAGGWGVRHFARRSAAG